jgi:predicted dehydrogenase
MLALIVGFGSIGKRHYEILCKATGVNGVHVVSSRPDKSIQIFDTIEHAAANHRYDYVVIASSTEKHIEDLTKVTAFFPLARVLVEKPLFHAYQGQLPFKTENIFVGYNLRFHPAIRKFRELCTDPQKIRYIIFQVGQYLPLWRPERDYRESYSAKRSCGGGVLLDLSHEIDLLICMAGDIAEFNSLVTHNSDLEIETEDIACIHGKTKSDTAFSVSMDYLSCSPTRLITAHLEDRTVKIDLIANALDVTDRTGETKTFKFGNIPRNSTYELLHKSILSGEAQPVSRFSDGHLVNYWIDRFKEKAII